MYGVLIVEAFYIQNLKCLINILPMFDNIYRVSNFPSLHPISLLQLNMVIYMNHVQRKEVNNVILNVCIFLNLQVYIHANDVTIE